MFGDFAGWKMDPLIESMYFLSKMGIIIPASYVSLLGGGFIVFFTPKIGEFIQLDEHFFQMGFFNHQLVININ